MARLILAALLAVPAGNLGRDPWDKQPQEWTLAETYQILTDSPWSPSKGRIEVSLVHRRIDLQTQRPTDSPTALTDPGLLLHIERKSQLPPVSVLWWSAKTLRLAQQRLRELRDPAAAPPLRAEELSDFVLVVEGAEALRILRDAAESLHETVFLELPDGMPLDFADVRFVEGEKAGEDFVAFHFPREIAGKPMLSADAEKVTFHCRATAKTSRPDRPNTLSIRAVFEPRKMRVPRPARPLNLPFVLRVPISDDLTPSADRSRFPPGISQRMLPCAVRKLPRG